MKNTPRPAITILTLLMACCAFAAVLLAFVGTGRASTQQTEDLLKAAGFKARPATTAVQQAQLRSLPAHKVSTVQKGGKKYYLYPDATRSVFFVGDTAQYESYRKLSWQEAVAEEESNKAAQLQDESFDVGMDTRSPVALLEYHYECPFKFTGTIDKLTYKLGPSEMAAADKQAAATAVARARD